MEHILICVACPPLFWNTITSFQHWNSSIQHIFEHILATILVETLAPLCFIYAFSFALSCRCYIIFYIDAMAKNGSKCLKFSFPVVFWTVFLFCFFYKVTNLSCVFLRGPIKKWTRIALRYFYPWPSDL